MRACVRACIFVRACVGIIECRSPQARLSPVADAGAGRTKRAVPGMQHPVGAAASGADQKQQPAQLMQARRSG